MNTYMSDKEQAQALKDLWKKYGTTILLAILVFMTVNFAWRYWLQYRTQQQEHASILFTQMIEAQTRNKQDEINLYAKNLMQNFSRSSYASFAAMLLAKEAATNSDFSAAKINLNWVISHSRKKEISELAKVRLARILIADQKPQKALTLLRKDKNNLYLPAKYEIMGDALVAQNKEQEAADFYHQALTQTANKKIDQGKTEPSPLLQIKAEQLTNGKYPS